ncbi:serine/threonine-protein kinase VRK1-like [Athalia rosae]|uniref:serine/threonine-protein kinase VRK1-like n=1 Tax=Athalia rosae TaxID=37344 RepID=UPI0020343304|nr:serine/threonine-protein kinase VRK1-like [Athalia rosae]
MPGKGAMKSKKGANGYKLPDPIPVGEVLTDMLKKSWIIGPSIGVGGFGEIYSAAPYTGGVPKDYPNVIKIEPHGNGPLFVEMHFYMRSAKENDIVLWKKQNKLSFLGMPTFISSGSHDCHDTKYRFVVMERFGKNLWDIFLENNRKFQPHSVYKIALQIIDVLEYLHYKTYVHADIKGANLLQSLKSPDQIYLVDFGLAYHINSQTEYKPNPKKAHNGTIEYTSRDMHMGVPTMRGDFEILSYNMIQWICGSLPWEKNLTNPSAVQKQKQSAFQDLPKFLKECFSSVVPEPINKFMTLLKNMEYNDTPNYQKFKDILVKGLKDMGHKPNGKLNLAASDKTAKSATTPQAGKAKKVMAEGTRKSRRLLELLSPNRSLNSTNDSDLGSPMNQKKSNRAQDNPRILKNIPFTDDPDSEVEEKQTKKTRNKNNKDADVKVASKDKKVLKKKTKHYDPDETMSDDQSQVSLLGTKSRPKNDLKRKQATVELESSIDENNDSTKDMFTDDDEPAQPTPPKRTSKWQECSTIKNSRVFKPGEYKRENQNKIQKAKKR